jgi:DUF4097 and DUF4098 domain-containing protein YvlB
VVAILVLVCLCLATAVALGLSSLFIADVRTSGPVVGTGAQEDRAFSVPPGAALTVDNFAGNVTVRAGDEGHILVVAVRRAASSATRERIQIQYRETSAGLEIRTVRPTGLRSGSVDLQIEVPPGTPLEIDTGAGNLELRGLVAGIRAETGSGTVRATGLQGDISLQTGSGSVEVQDATGPVSVETGSGNLILRGVNGDLTGHTGSGSIRVEGASGQVRVDTGSGSVEYTGTPAGECRFETGSGSVVLALPVALNARVDLQSNSGRVNVQFPVDGQSTQQRVRGVIGSGEDASITVRTGSGSIDVRQW